ncbi:MAG TPA: APC family permease [Nitrososphaerales archaeon]|nr:APC family permease [Nitrososphaerales archaeon]
MGQNADQEKSAPQAFVRESTGLVKNVSFLDTITLNLSNMSIGPLLATVAGSTVATMVIVPTVTGLNLVAASIIAFILSVPQIVVYTIMTRRYPRTGGDYVWLSRTFGGFWGSTLSFWGYTMETTAFIALVAILLDFAIGSVFLTQGNTSAWVFNLFSVPGTQFEFAAVIFTIVIAINIIRPKAGFRLVSILALFGILSLVLAIGVLFSAGQTGIANYVTSLGLNGAKITPTSSGLSFLINGTSTYTPSGAPFDINWTNTIFVLPVVFAFVYPWLNAAPAVASEIKGKSAMKWNVPISAVVAFVLLTACFATLYAVAGMPFINAAFSNTTYAADGLNFFTLAMGVSGTGSALSWIIGIGWIAMQLGTIAYAVIVISRYLLAQSLDRFLPGRLSYVSQRFGSPIIAHAVDYIVTIVLIALATYYYASYSALFGAILASMIYFIFIGLAATVHAVRKEKGGAMLALALAGILDMGVFAFISYQYLANPAFTGLNNLTYTFLVATLIAGAAIYLASSWYHKKQGIDISLNYKELPPE